MERQSVSSPPVAHIIFTDPLLSHECGKNRIMNTTNGIYPWSVMTQIFRSGSLINDGDRETFGIMTQINN